MNLLPRTATARISLAIGLSFLLHSVVMFSPLIELPRTETPLPPLTARLEPLPRIDIEPEKPKPRPKRTETPPRPSDASTEEEQTAEAVQEAPQIDAEPAAEEAAPEPAPSHPLLPKRAQLTFTAYQGEGGLQLGTATHRLDIEQGHYVLKAVTQTTGIASLFKSYLLTQTSRGEAGAQGLRPLVYSEDKKLSGGTQSLSAEFDWAGHRLRFSHGGGAALPEQGQDIASFLYQLSQLPLDKGTVPLSISNGKKLEHYELEVGDEEYLQTHLGRLRALPLRKVRGAGEEGLDIWLGLEYRLLPVKIRQIDRNGKTAGEMVISEILVADE